MYRYFYIFLYTIPIIEFSILQQKHLDRLPWKTHLISYKISNLLSSAILYGHNSLIYLLWEGFKIVLR